MSGCPSQNGPKKHIRHCFPTVDQLTVAAHPLALIILIILIAFAWWFYSRAAGPVPSRSCLEPHTTQPPSTIAVYPPSSHSPFLLCKTASPTGSPSSSSSSWFWLFPLLGYGLHRRHDCQIRPSTQKTHAALHQYSNPSAPTISRPRPSLTLPPA